MTDSNATKQPPYCDGHFKLFSIRCWCCWNRADCRWVTAFNDYADERWNKR